MDFSQTCISASPMYPPPVQPEVNTSMYLRKTITLQADSCHNLDPRQMICICFELHAQCISIYHSVVKVKNCVFEFFELQIASACTYASSSDMLSKNTWGVKNWRPIRINIANRQVRSKGLISAEAKKLLYQNIFNSLNDTQYYTVYSIFSQV